MKLTTATDLDTQREYILVNRSRIPGIRPETDTAVWLYWTNPANLGSVPYPQIKGTVQSISKETLYLTTEEEKEILDAVAEFIKEGGTEKW